MQAYDWVQARALTSTRASAPERRGTNRSELALRFRKPGDEVQFLVDPGSRDEPPIGADMTAKGIRWDMLMVFYLRLMAGAWMLRGLGYWALVIGLGDVPLSEERRLRQAFIVGFAILECSAAVGLWLLTPWGKSLWLALAFLEILLGVTGYARIVGFADAASTLVGIAGFGALAYAMRRQRF